jgi:L-seryl-tRNA(Ser) seleniumtransferase
MLLLEDYGLITVHFAGLPPGTSSLLFKFVPPETLAAVGGPTAVATAVDKSLSRLAGLLREPARLAALLFGEETAAR